MLAIVIASKLEGENIDAKHNSKNRFLDSSGHQSLFASQYGLILAIQK